MMDRFLDFHEHPSVEPLERRTLLSAAPNDGLSGLRVEGDPAAASAVMLTFDRALDAAWSQDVSHYIIDGKVLRGAKDGPVSAVPTGRSPTMTSAAYDDASHTVTLTPSEPLRLGKQLRSIWIAAGESGEPAIYHALRFRAGRKVAIVDQDGDVARISMTVNGRAAVLQDLTTGSPEQLWLTNADATPTLLATTAKAASNGAGIVSIGSTVITGTVREEDPEQTSLNFGDTTGGFQSPSPAEPDDVPVPAPLDNGSAPHVRLVSPKNQFEAASPAYLLIRAEADDSNGTIDRVEFFNGDQLLDTATAAPYCFAWRDVAPGKYTITARAIDSTSDSTTSTAVEVTVHAPPQRKEIIVSPNGNDANKGANEGHALRTIGRAAELARPGDTVLIRPGVYRESIVLDHSGTASKPITFQAKPGTVFVDGSDPDGTHVRSELFVAKETSAARFITVRGITFRNASNDPQNNNAAVRTGEGWRVEDCTFASNDGNGLGAFGRNVVLLRDVAKDNGCCGIGGTGATDLLLLDCESTGNNTAGYSGGLEGGGGKFTRTNGVLVENYNSHDNWGPGIWFDYNNINVAVRSSNLHDNHSLHWKDGREKIGGTGIFFELGGIREDGNGTGKAGETGAMLAEGNQISNNEAMGITVYSSQNVTLQNNDLSANPIELLGDRQAPFVIEDLVIRENNLTQSPILADSDTAGRAKRSGVSIDDNTYKGKADSRGLFRWGGDSIDSLKDVRQKLGYEHHGKAE